LEGKLNELWSAKRGGFTGLPSALDVYTGPSSKTKTTASPNPLQAMLLAIGNGSVFFGNVRFRIKLSHAYPSIIIWSC